jgi:hypothetical protein
MQVSVRLVRGRWRDDRWMQGRSEDQRQLGDVEPLAGLLRPRNAGSNTAADHIALTGTALAQLPGVDPGWPGRKVLVRTDGAGATHDFVNWAGRTQVVLLARLHPARRGGTANRRIPKSAWTAAYDADGQIRDGAFVAELTGLLDLASWPAGMQVIIRRERPHPGGQLRITDVEGNRITAFATNTRPGGPGTQLPDLELRHRRRARCEDRIRQAKDAGLANLPLHTLAQNRIWLAVVGLAGDLVAWIQLLTLTGTDARLWEIKRLRLRLLTIAGQLARTARRVVLHLHERHRWSGYVTDGLARLAALPAPT